jgi:glyoxylase-like metal-dependent hydrolase (beta-lactamase superfamily II)
MDNEAEPMGLLDRLHNIYVVDTKMWGFAHYNAAYLVEGKELALIDTGMPNRFETVRAGIKAHGFSLSDISYIFVTHCEHPDHSGNVAPLLRESPRANVYINPIGLEYLTDPSIDSAKRKERVSPELFARYAEAVMEPVPPSRIKYLKDGDVFDLGNGENLRIIFAPGHQPSGIVILEEKNMGLFINDLVGIYLPDADAHYPLNPFRSDNRQATESLQKLIDLPVTHLYLGHYGICERPKEIMARALNKIQRLLDIGIKYSREGKPEGIASEVYEMMKPEFEKIRLVRGEELFRYASHDHQPTQAKEFAKYFQERFIK